MKDFTEELKLLYYPHGDLSVCMDRLRELRSLGIESLLFKEESGKLKLFIVGKGFRSVVLAGLSDDRMYALKLRRSDSPISSMRAEASMLSLSNNVGVGPRIYAYTDDIIVMEYIQGVTLERWMQSVDKKDVPSVKYVIKRCLDDCFKLDSIGLDHGELSDASDHVLIDRDLKPTIVDFSNASIMRRPSNVTSFLSYLMHGRVATRVSEILGNMEIPIEDLRAYKRYISRDAYERIIKAIGLG